MTRLLLILSFLMLSVTAQADGFICQALDEGLRVKIFNHVKPEMGTRNAAIMILSDVSPERGERTKAILRSENGALKSESSNFVGYLSLREDAYLQPDEEIINKTLESIYSVIVKVDFSYQNPVPGGTRLDGEAIIIDRNGDRSYLDLSCRRYLKGDNFLFR